MKRTLELDDIPWNLEKCLARLDAIKDVYPGFKCSVFAIPAEMTDDVWRDLLYRKEWIEVCPHGFTHDKRECRTPGMYIPHLKMLEDIAEDERWTKLYKAPWYGYDSWFMQELVDRGFAICLKDMFGAPLPVPKKWKSWNIRNTEAARVIAGEGDDRQHQVIHPEYETYRAANYFRSGLTRRNVRRWKESWGKDDEWQFVSELVRPAALKLNLGCGPQVWDGWTCLDPRAEELGQGVIQWDFSKQLPFAPNQADAVFTSHVFAYVDEEKYTEALLEIWRVLRPLGVLRMSEDETDSGYVWRRPGQPARGTGEIKSLPTRSKICGALAAVGFEIHPAGPGVTVSPHKDVLLGDGRERRYRLGHKFYVEGVKKIHHAEGIYNRDSPDVLDLRRPHKWDVRAPSDKANRDFGRYHLP